MTRTIVAIVIYNRFSNLERWIACWKQCTTEGAELVIIHNYYDDETEKEKYSQYCGQQGIQYVPRLGEGYDIGAFQDVCRGRLSGFPDYDYLLWCTDDCIPMRKNFIAPFLHAFAEPRVGVSCMKLYSYPGRGPWYPDHVRTTGFCLPKEIAQALTFPVDPIQTKDHCWDFEVRAGINTLYGQILQMGLVPKVVAPDAESPLWDTEFPERLPRQMEHNLIFNPSLPSSAGGACPAEGRIVVAVVIYNRFQNLERWIACWKQCDPASGGTGTITAELVIIHNHYGDQNEKEKYSQYCVQNGITYVPRSGGGYDIGAFQDVCRNRLPGFPDYEYLLWCTDDCIPMRKDFIRPFISALLDPRVGVSCIQISSEWATHVRTTGFCIRKATAEVLTFPEDPILTKEHCFAFEHRAGEGTFYRQILNMGLVPLTVAPDGESPLWDTEFRDRFGKVLTMDPRQLEHDQMFNSTFSTLQSKNIYHDVPVFIICRDRLTPLQQLVGWLERSGHTNIVLVDNASTYPPLLEFLESCPHHLVSLPENVGHLAVWAKGLQTQFASKTLPGFYVVSDCDVVPDDSCPKDLIARLHSILRGRPNMDKAGPGLRIDDLPDCFQFKRDVIDWESQFWESALEPAVYDAPIDTTFALYRPGTAHSIFHSVRTGSPYVARHLPWYQNSAALSAEELYYRQHMNKNIGSWGKEVLPPDLAHALEDRRRRMGSK